MNQKLWFTFAGFSRLFSAAWVQTAEIDITSCLSESRVLWVWCHIINKLTWGGPSSSPSTRNSFSSLSNPYTNQQLRQLSASWAGKWFGTVVKARLTQDSQIAGGNRRPRLFCQMFLFANMRLCFCDVEAYYLIKHSFISSYKTLAKGSAERSSL